MRKEIIQTSLEQFLKHGIRKMSVQKLVAPLSISTKTVYKHFENKEDLLREALLFYYDQHYQVFGRYAESENPVFLLCNAWHGAMESEMKINQVFFQDLLYYYPELNEKIAAISDKKILKIFIRILERGMREGFFKEDISPVVVMRGMVILYTTIVRKVHFKKLNLTPFDLLRNTMLIYVSGICTTKGIKEFRPHVQNLQPVQQPGIIPEKINVNPLHLN